MSRRMILGAVCFACALALAGMAQANVFNGTLYYTTNAGGQNIWDVTYSYDDSTQTFSLGSATNVSSTNGADGIIFGTNGNLLIGGQGSNNVYEVNPVGGALVNTQAVGTNSFHLTLDPSGTKVYTSAFGGPLKTLSVPIGSGVNTTNITGGDSGVTQVAFGDGGTVFYVDGNPNGFGDLGTIILGSGVTTRLYTSIQPAHGLIYDPFTDLITFFGAGQTGTMNATNGSGLLTSGNIFGVSDFDQGAVDGQGHALVAGSNSITFIDYHLSGDITKPDFTTSVGGFGAIDDVAPLVGAGSQHGTIPEPASMALVAMSLAGLGYSLRRRQRN